MNDYVKPLAQWCLAVAIVGCLLALFTCLAAIDGAGRVGAAVRVWLSRALLFAGLRSRSSDAALHDLRLPVSGLDVERENGEADDFAALAEYGVVPFSERVRR